MSYQKEWEEALSRLNAPERAPLPYVPLAYGPVPNPCNYMNWNRIMAETKQSVIPKYSIGQRLMISEDQAENSYYKDPNGAYVFKLDPTFTFATGVRKSIAVRDVNFYGIMETDHRIPATEYFNFKTLKIKYNEIEYKWEDEEKENVTYEWQTVMENVPLTDDKGNPILVDGVVQYKPVMVEGEDGKQVPKTDAEGNIVYEQQPVMEKIPLLDPETGEQLTNPDTGELLWEMEEDKVTPKMREKKEYVKVTTKVTVRVENEYKTPHEIVVSIGNIEINYEAQYDMTLTLYGIGKEILDRISDCITNQVGDVEQLFPERYVDVDMKKSRLELQFYFEPRDLFEVVDVDLYEEDKTSIGKWHIEKSIAYDLYNTTKNELNIFALRDIPYNPDEYKKVKKWGIKIAIELPKELVNLKETNVSSSINPWSKYNLISSLRFSSDTLTKMYPYDGNPEVKVWFTDRNGKRVNWKTARGYIDLELIVDNLDTYAIDH